MSNDDGLAVRHERKDQRVTENQRCQRNKTARCNQMFRFRRFAKYEFLM